MYHKPAGGTASVNCEPTPLPHRFKFGIRVSKVEAILGRIHFISSVEQWAMPIYQLVLCSTQALHPCQVPRTSKTGGEGGGGGWRRITSYPMN